MSQDTLTDRYNPVKEIVETNRLVCSVPYVHGINQSSAESGLGMRHSWRKRRRKRKQKPGVSKFSYLPAGYVRLLAFRIYSKTILYSALRSLLSPVFCVVWNFASIPMYRENETAYAIPT